MFSKRFTYDSRRYLKSNADKMQQISQTKLFLQNLSLNAQAKFLFLVEQNVFFNDSEIVFPFERQKH